MKYTIPRGHLSASSIGMLLKCPKQYEFRYVKELIIPPGAALAAGSISHKVLEQYYKDAMTSNTRLSPAQTGELSMAVFDDWLDENENVVKADERKDLSTLVRDLMVSYVDCVGQNIKPLDVEKEHKYHSRCGVEILMYFDLLHEIEDGETGIGDYKVTGKKWNLGSLTNSLQFNIYTIASGIGDVQIHNLVKSKGSRVSTGPAKEGITDYATNIRVLRHRFGGEQSEHFEDLIEQVAKQITLGVFPPCSPDSWACTPEWCGYWKLCRGR